MDKFGIFELLDTLSQIASETENGENSPRPDSESPFADDSTANRAPAQQPAPAQRVSADDKSFLPPDFNNAPTGEAKPSRNALNSLYERHESISKRIDKNK